MRGFQILALKEGMCYDVLECEVIFYGINHCPPS